MGETTPVLVLSDSPQQPSGLGRIARDITSLLYKHQGHLNIKVAQLGYYHDQESEWPWPVWKMLDEGNFGQDDVKRTWWRFAGERPGIIFSIWDPARCSGIAHEAQALPIRLWGYFPIDGTNRRGRLGGPAEQVIKEYDRVLGYGRWGASVLNSIRGGVKTSYLPHGLSEVWAPAPAEKKYVGAVVTNQPRKDLGLLFQTWALMKEARPELKFWLHTDIEVRHWSVPELAQLYGLNNESLRVTLDLEDHELAQMYRQCWVTMLPTLGEGFGYTIVESMACGVPCVSTDVHAGGAELVPYEEWRVKAKAWKLESCYAVERPVVAPKHFATKAIRALEWAQKEPEVSAAYCSGAVAHLNWNALEPRWLSWFRSGLKEVRGEV